MIAPSLEILAAPSVPGNLLADMAEDFFEVALAMFVAGLGMIVGGVNKYRKHRLIEDTPTEGVSALAMGRSEVEGTAVPLAAPLERPFTDSECLHVSWSIEEYTEDDDGDSDWDTVESGSHTTPFFVDDGTGKVLVDVSDDPSWELSDHWSRGWKLDAGERPDDPIVEFCREQGIDPVADVPRKLEQTALPPDNDVYVFGEAVPLSIGDDEELPDDAERVTIQRDGLSGKFIVSDREGAELANHYGDRAPELVFRGLALSAASLFVLVLGSV